MKTEEYTRLYKNSVQLVIDIETMPNNDVLHLLPTPKVASNLKDPVKIEAAITEGREKQIEKMALSPLTGIIACIGVYSEAGEATLFAGDNEKAALDMLWQIIEFKKLITFNGKSFDVPFIFKRGIILGCEWATIPNMKRYTDRYKSDKHIDLMAEFCNYGEYESLDTLARFILGDKKVEFDFREIPELMKTTEGQERISQYCQQDCLLTWKLAKRMGF
jgi:DNA polymerase elongation subunit (family B)